MAYRYEMREFREAFRAQLAANPLRDQIAIRMLMALDTLQKEVGNMPMGAIYRLAFTGRLDLWAELAILEEQLRTATTNEDKARILTRRAAILSTSGLAIADLRATFARMMVTDSLPVAKAIIPDVYLLLPSDQQGGEPRLTSISHFYPNYTPPATKGMIPGATYGHTSLDGDTLLRERFPYLDAATDGIRKSFNMSVAMTARDMPAQVAAVNAWGIGEYNKIADAVHM